MKHKFRKGQTIGAIVNGQGLNEATITKVDSKYYYCKIMNGTALIPIAAENNYQVISKPHI